MIFTTLSIIGLSGLAAMTIIKNREIERKVDVLREQSDSNLERIFNLEVLIQDATDILNVLDDELKDAFDTIDDQSEEDNESTRTD